MAKWWQILQDSAAHICQINSAYSTAYYFSDWQESKYLSCACVSGYTKHCVRLSVPYACAWTWAEMWITRRMVCVNHMCKHFDTLTATPVFIFITSAKESMFWQSVSKQDYATPKQTTEFVTDLPRRTVWTTITASMLITSVDANCWLGNIWWTDTNALKLVEINVMLTC